MGGRGAEIRVGGLRQMGQRAMQLAEAGRHAEAVAIWERMHRREPANADICMALGAALLACGRIDDAAQWLVACCQRYPSHAGLVGLHGRALVRQRRWKPALGAFFHALTLDPSSAEIHADIANALYWERQSQAALPYAEFACRAELSTTNVSTYLCILFDLGLREEGLAFVERLMIAQPENRATLLLFHAAALQALDRLAEGLIAAGEAARLAPDNSIAQHHYAAARLLHGDLSPETWAHYEGRSGLLETQRWPAPQLRWTDQDIRGRTIVVHAEQGLGDTLQFIRYVPMLAARGARVIVAVQPSLVKLLQGTPGAADVISAGKLPAFDLYCPLLSLPGQFGTTLETIPPALPYALDLPQGSQSPRLQVGLVWTGRSVFVEDRRRSLDPALLAPLADVPGVDFHSLQFDPTTLPLPGMQNAMEGVSDFAETAERVAKLDLVIAVDTSVAHLAATMGKPVWLLNRQNGCWRWLLQREDSPWYPSVRIFRQPTPDDWASVIARVRDALAVAAAEHQRAMSLAA